MNAPALLIGCAGVGALALIVLGLALARGAALADRRALHPAPHPIPHPARPFPSSTPARAAAELSASEIRDRVLADTWHREGRLSPAGYLRLCELMYRGLDVYPYWSGGELHGTAVVWDGTRGPHGAGERLTVAEWNAAAEHDTGAPLDADGADGASARGGVA